MNLPDSSSDFPTSPPDPQPKVDHDKATAQRIDGFFIAKPGEHLEATFARAKSEAVRNAYQTIARIQSMNLATFLHHKIAIL